MDDIVLTMLIAINAASFLAGLALGVAIESYFRGRPR